MAVLAEITELLRRWDVWKRVEAAPDRVDALEKRIGNLEARLARAPGEACPSCGALDFRVKNSKVHPHPMIGKVGGRLHEMECGSCGFKDEKTITPNLGK